MSRWTVRATIVIGIAAIVALRIYSWGAPIRAEYRVLEPPPGQEQVHAPGTVSATTIVRQGTNPQAWTARDVDGDGTWDEFTTPQGTFARPSARAAPDRWLVVCLDGVPLAAMQSLWDRGHFREFFRPTATVSTLPSDTETALTEVLHAAPVPGYEHLYFDRAANRIRGGAGITLTGAGIPYIQALDYDAPGWAKIMPYVLPRKTYRADIGRFRNDFLASSAPVFLAHIASSDAVLHVSDMQQAEPLLIDFENAIRGIYLDARGRLGVILFSDHGNTQTLSHAVPVETLLASRGWQVRDSVDGPRDAAIPSYGLVGFIAIYCQPAAIEPLAEDLRALPGTDVIVSRHMSREDNLRVHVDPSPHVTIRAANSPGTAELTWSPDGARYKYVAQDGDPLALVPVFDSLRAAGKLDGDGFAGDADLFSATLSGTFPDSAERIRIWATNHVRNPADVLVSLKPGYYHGAGLLGRVVTLAGTHGGLERSASLGFGMATYPLPAATRLADLIPANLLERRAMPHAAAIR